uniref:MFS domain-containing protein n=1 Tax=Panagrellus redivivus TaxID=6233 RepID=A0A7E4VAS1_PANRE
MPPQKTEWRSIYVGTFVGFLATVQMSAFIPTVWPYLKIIDPEISETTFGMIRGMSAFGGVVSSACSGYISNKLSDTKPCLLVEKVLVIFAAFLYLTIEIVPKGWGLIIFTVYECLIGVAMGLSSVFRTHVAMSSTEADRPRAFGITMLAISLGFLVGSLFQMTLSFLPYPGIPIAFGIRLSLYTAPIIFGIGNSVIGFILLSTFYDGKMRVPPRKQPIESTSETNKMIEQTDSDAGSGSSGTDHPVSTIGYDKMAVVICILTKTALDAYMTMMMSIGNPYTMTTFELSRQESVKLNSSMMAATGFFSLLFSVGYGIFNFGKRLPERIAVTFGLSLVFGCIVATYPFPFLSQTISYEHPIGTPAIYDQSAAKELLSTNENVTIDTELIGCSINYAWCQTTHKIDLIVYIVTQIMVFGIATPLMMVNLDILYSKILGPIKQGVLQAVFMVFGQILHIVGPVVITTLYAETGPTYIWILSGVLLFMALGMFTGNYKRMISFTKRVEDKTVLTDLVMT